MASPTASLASLSVTKTRERSDTASLLPNFFDPDDNSLPIVPVPGASADSYTSEKLQNGLVYAEKCLKRREISPRAELILVAYKKSIKEALTATTDARRRDKSIEVMIEEIIIQQSSFLKPGKSEQQVYWENMLLELRDLKYLARYGDYMKIIPTRLRHHASAQKLQGWEKLSAKNAWTDITEKIDDEEVRHKEAMRPGGQSEDAPRPTTMAIVNACEDLGLSKKDAFWSIKGYARRNSDFHSGLDALKTQGRFFELAETLYADKNDLASVSSYKSQTDTDHLRDIIQAEIDECFENAHEIPDLPTAWIASSTLYTILKDALQKTQKPSKDEIKKANILASEEKSKLKAARQTEDSKGSSSAGSKKRVASTTEPRGSDREEGGIKKRRIQLIAKCAKIEAQLANAKAELAEAGIDARELNLDDYDE